MSLIKIISQTRRIFRGYNTPKAKNTYSTASSSMFYHGMDSSYRWFRQDEITRKCVTNNAYFSTFGGFETVQEPTTEENGIKEKIDEINRLVNLDKVLFVAQIKRSIYGKAAFEIVRDQHGYPTKLISLNSKHIKPDLDENWNHIGYTYQGRKEFYEKEDILYFTNLEIESDYNGLSDIEPILTILEARHNILRENIPEIARTLWAPFVILKADTSSLPPYEAENTIQNLASIARAGKSIAINESVEATVVNLTPDIKGLNDLLTKIEEAITTNFGVPRFLVGRPIENRATAYAELEAYITGTITGIQRYLKREIEKQFYEPITRNILLKEGNPESSIRVKHQWNHIRITDVFQMADALAKLWGTNGQGPIGGDKKKAWEFMGWDPSELEG